MYTIIIYVPVQPIVTCYCHQNVIAEDDKIVSLGCSLQTHCMSISKGTILFTTMKADGTWVR